MSTNTFVDSKLPYALVLTNESVQFTNLTRQLWLHRSLEAKFQVEDGVVEHAIAIGVDEDVVLRRIVGMRALSESRRHAR